MWQTLKKWLYNLIAWSGILNHIMPILICRFSSVLFKPKDLSNHEEADRSGRKIRMILYNGQLYPPVGIDKIRSIPDVYIRSSDVLLCSYPKAGCHWLHEMLHMLVTKKIRMTKLGKELAGGMDVIPNILLDSQPSPRVLNSHLKYDDLPHGVKEKKVKIIFLVRNPKDSVVSFFNHHSGLTDFYGYDGTFDHYFEMFLEGRVDYGSYFDYILHWDTILKESANNPIHLITFEDLIKHPKETMQKVAAFLSVTVSEDFLDQVVDTCKFANMKSIRSKQNEISAKMYRKGVVGDWKSWLTDAQSKAIDEVWQNRMLECTYQPEY